MVEALGIVVICFSAYGIEKKLDSIRKEIERSNDLLREQNRILKSKQS